MTTTESKLHEALKRFDNVADMLTMALDVMVETDADIVDALGAIHDYVQRDVETECAMGDPDSRTLAKERCRRRIAQAILELKSK